jgi:hypothetical protein
MYVDLGGCLTCWSVYTGKDSAPYSAFFAKICA